MPPEINCVFTKGLIPFVEREVGPEGVAALLRTAGRPPAYLIAEDNWMPFSVAAHLRPRTRPEHREAPAGAPRGAGVRGGGRRGVGGGGALEDPAAGRPVLGGDRG